MSEKRTPQPLVPLFETLVGADYVRPATTDDSVEGRQPLIVVAPGSAEAAGAVLRVANDAGLGVVPRGGATKLGWGNRPHRADVIISTQRLSQLRAHAHGDMTATVEAGMPFAALQRALAAHGQMLALDPAWPETATIGGVLATDASGPLRVRYGTLRDLVIGITVALPDGTLAKAGGNVVKNVAGYDLMKLWTGSLGTLGLTTSVTLRLHPLPEISASLVVQAPTATAAAAFMLDTLNSPLTPTGLQLVSRAQGYDVFVRFAGIEASVVSQSRALVALAGAVDLAVAALDDEQMTLAWQAHAAIYAAPAGAIVGRISVLPTMIAATLDMLNHLADRLRLRLNVVLQATGTGQLRFEGDNEAALAAALGVARARITESGGSLVAHHVPAALKERIDVWGVPGDALPLMRRVKEQFDPGGIMNDGRYIGGI